ncbi:43240_t:CDS:2, partial [Gigaspora margarita]
MWDIIAPLFKEIHEDLTDELKYLKLKHEIKDCRELIERLAARAKLDPLSEEFSQHLDKNDKLSHLREEFSIPKSSEVTLNGVVSLNPNEPSMYFCGNSLGLMPKRARILVNQELDVWAKSGVNGHFTHPHNRPWVSIDDTVVEKMADVYAVESQIKFHGYDPATTLITVNPPPGEYIINLNDILNIIEKEGSSIALVLFSGIHYYSGQFFKLKKIAAAAKKKGCIVGFDLSHAVGNVVLKLHKWNVDFAVWCSYKYLNSGPGGIAGIFIHEKHAHDFNRPRFAGWWGSDRRSRFQMDKPFNPIPGAGGFQVSNPSVLDTVSLLASLDVFAQTSMVQLRAKSILLTGYLEYLLDKQLNGLGYKNITPRDPHQRGCQISLVIDENKLEKVINGLNSYGAVVDERTPDCIRIAPNPMYNSFSDVFRFVKALKIIMGNLGFKFEAK